MNKSIVLLERPVRKSFDESMRGQVEEILRQRSKEVPLKVQARWHKSEPLLRLETKLGSLDIAFGPKVLQVVAHLSPIGRFLDTKKTRVEALSTANDLADALGV